jgi:hypothetical protein
MDASSGHLMDMADLRLQASHGSNRYWLPA